MHSRLAPRVKSHDIFPIEHFGCLCVGRQSLNSGSALGQPSPADTFIPVNAWVHDPVLASVALSPDGKHLVAVSLADINSTPTIGIWNADALAEAPTRFELTSQDGSRWKPLSAFWLNDSVIYAVGRQNLDLSVGARKIKTFRDKGVRL